MAKRIGIVGVSPEGSSIFYRMIGRRVADLPPGGVHPEVLLHNVAFSLYVEAIRRDDWSAVASYLALSAEVLSRAGADFCVLPDNATHHALPLASASSPLPFLNMTELVAEAVQRSGHEHVGLIGTRYVMSGSTYQTVLGLRGIKLHVPGDEDAEAIDRIIFEEAVRGSVSERSIDRVSAAMDRLAKNGCETVILGASEASLMLRHESLPLSVVEPIALLADAAIAHATEVLKAG